MNNSLARLILILFVFVAAGLACNYPGNASSVPPTTVPMSTQDLQNLEQQVQATLNNSNANEDVTVTLTQEQLNGILAEQLAQQPDHGISDTSVVLTNGHMEVYGTVSQSGLSANMQVVMQPTVDAAGNPRLEITSISLGGLPVPDVLNNRVEMMANNALSEYLASISNSFKVKSITITEGQMAVTGTRQ